MRRNHSKRLCGSCGTTGTLGCVVTRNPIQPTAVGTTFRLALTASNLEVSCLKGTTITNWSHGPYKSGQNLVTGEHCLEMLLRDCATDEWLEEQAALLSQDMLLEDELSPEIVLEMYNAFTQKRSAFVIWQSLVIYF